MWLQGQSPKIEQPRVQATHLLMRQEASDWKVCNQQWATADDKLSAMAPAPAVPNSTRHIFSALGYGETAPVLEERFFK